MTPIKMFHYRGFLIRICNNGSASHPYEWTVEPISPEARRKMSVLVADWNARQRRSRWMRPLCPHITDEWMLSHYYVKRHLNSKRKMRQYDPTSMPTAFGPCSAQEYALDEVDNLLGRRSERVGKRLFRPRRPKLAR